VSISTNNIVNPFTPYGHPDLLRQALVTAMAAHLGNLDQLAWLPELITTKPGARAGPGGYGLAPAAAPTSWCSTRATQRRPSPSRPRSSTSSRADASSARTTRTSELSIDRRG